MGARGRRLHRASVRREAAADLDEINAVAPDTPVFLLHLYDRALLNARCAARRRLHQGHARARRAARSCATREGKPTGLLLAKPNAGILYATLAKGPKLPFEYQLNSTRHFMRELNRLGVTGAIDAGGGFQNYPEDYAGHRRSCAADGQLTVRLAYNLFTQKPKGEKDGLPALDADRRSTSRATTTSATTAPARCWCSRPPTSRTSASRAPDMPPEMEGELEEVVRILAQNRWPWRLHATYDETIAARSTCSRR